MTRGNQRAIDRARAAARTAKGRRDARDGDPKARAEADAKALQEKVAKKAAKAAEESGGGGGDGGANGKKKEKNPYQVHIK